MSDKLPKSLDRDIDWDKWDEFLFEVDKEKLVDFMLSRMSTDDHFMRLAYEYFNNSDEIANADSLIKAYSGELDYECSQYIPDVDFIVSLTERFIKLAENLTSLYSKVQFYVSVIVKLDKAVVVDGAGMQGDDDYLIEEEMRSIDRMLISAINDKKDKISDNERKEILGFIKSSQQEYTIELMDGGYLDNISSMFEG